VVVEVRSRLQEGMDRVERRLAGEWTGNPEVLDPDLAAAVAHFQGRHGIAVDSVVGPETVRAMNVPLEQRIDELRLNLDRIRRLPRDFGERAVLVNIAGFELRVLEHNRPVISMAVVVGQPSWRTTVFQDEIDYLEVNPYWHVPESIEREELLPRVREDPAHLARQDISLVPAGDNFGTPVPTDTIDWARVDPDDFPYDFRQEPGPRNALGRVKFMFPNPHNIYLHDTPADQLFQRDFRAFSHGCVRLERPLELARYLLQTSSGVDPAELDRILASGERTRLELDTPVPVYLAYLTTWVEDGTVSFHQDIYHFDDASLE
jgi:murein L,D-transpeptidase YcbB/YkuD